MFHPLRPAAVPASTTSMAAALAEALLTGCAQVNPSFDPSRPRHTPSGFRNNHTAFDGQGLGELLRWRMAALRDDLVLISLDHCDPLDDAGVRVLNGQPGGPSLSVVPRGTGRWLAGRGSAAVVVSSSATRRWTRRRVPWLPRARHRGWPRRSSSCWRSAKLDTCRAAAAGRDRDP